MKLGTALALALAIFVVCAAAVAREDPASAANVVVDPAAKAVAAAKEQTAAALKKIEETTQKLNDVSDALHYTKIDLATKNSRLADALREKANAERESRRARAKLAAEKARQNILRSLNWHGINPANAAVQTPQQRQEANYIPPKTVKTRLHLARSKLPKNVERAKLNYAKKIAAILNVPATRIVIGDLKLKNVTAAAAPAATSFLELDVEVDAEAALDAELALSAEVEAEFEAEAEAEVEGDADAEIAMFEDLSQEIDMTPELDQKMFGESLASVDESTDADADVETYAEEEALVSASAQDAWVLAEGAARAEVEDELDAADAPAPPTPAPAPQPNAPVSEGNKPLPPPPGAPAPVVTNNTAPVTNNTAPATNATTPAAPGNATAPVVPPANNATAPVVPPANNATTPAAPSNNSTAPAKPSEPAETRTVVVLPVTILPGATKTAEPSDAVFNHLINKLRSGELNKLIPEVDKSYIPKAKIITHTKDETTGAPMDRPKKVSGEKPLVRAVVLETQPVGYTVRTDPEWLAVEGQFQVPEYVATPTVTLVPPTVI